MYRTENVNKKFFQSINFLEKTAASSVADIFFYCKNPGVSQIISNPESSRVLALQKQKSTVSKGIAFNFNHASLQKLPKFLNTRRLKPLLKR
jgi:hypothetical protein